MKRLVRHLVKKVKEEKGASMVEYGLLVALIAMTVMVVLTPLGQAIAGLFTGVTTALAP